MNNAKTVVKTDNPGFVLSSQFKTLILGYMSTHHIRTSDLAKRMNSKISNISMLLSGRHALSMNNLAKLCDALDIDIHITLVKRKKVKQIE